VRKSVLPKNAAPTIFPLFSKALLLIKVLAHNLFHKICEEKTGCGQVGCGWLSGILRPASACVRDGTIPAPDALIVSRGGRRDGL
jgi:hypothetical protein